VPGDSDVTGVTDVSGKVARDGTEVSWVIQVAAPAAPLAGAGAGAAGPKPAPDADLARYRETLTELCRIAANDADLQGLLRRVAELAAQGLPAVDAVSVILGPPNRPSVLASSSALAQAADGLQHLAGTGPAFDAFASAQPVLAQDLSSDPRWPALQRRQGAEGAVRAWLALPIVVAQAAVGVVMLYGRADAAFSPEVVAQAAPYVAAAGALVRDNEALAELVRVRDQLHEALASRAVIDQAKGMIMMARGCEAEEAFALLVRMSSLSNRKVRELATEFVKEVASGRRAPQLP
jgi:hypothetical protein